jgi:hypothetical protein
LCVKADILDAIAGMSVSKLASSNGRKIRRFRGCGCAVASRAGGGTLLLPKKRPGFRDIVTVRQ